MALSPAPVDACNGQIISWSFERLNAHDVDAPRAFWTAETVERFPERTCHGAEEIAAYFQAMFAALPDWHTDVVALAEDGDHVFVRWHLSGTHRGDLFGVAPTGKRIAVDGIDHFVLRERKVVSNFVVADQMQVARQIGMMPREGAALDTAMRRAFNARTKLIGRLRR